MQYNVKGYNRFIGIDTYIDAKSSKEALELFLKENNIFYTTIEKMTNKINQKLLDSGFDNLQIIEMIDFIVKNENSCGPSASSNYRIY